VETFGKYQVLEQVGEGGFGKVYRGFDPVLKREVAIKTCHLHSPDLRERFIREAEIAASLRHPGIVTVFDFGDADGVPYLVQEYLTGEDLEHLLERGEPARLEHRVWILRQAGEALQYAHAHGVVHRDVKPANIRVEANGAVRLMDFGIAKLVQTDRNLTQMGFSLGTVGYLSPEQLLGREIDHRADVFSFGVLAYEVLVGRRPFGGESVTAVLYAIANAEPEPVDAVVPAVPPRLSALVERCLKKEVGERFQHMGRVVEELDLVLREMRGTGAAVGAGASPAGAGAGKAPDLEAGPPGGTGAATRGNVAAPSPEAPVGAASPSRPRGRRRAGIALGVGALALAVFGIVNVATFSRGEEGSGDGFSGEPAVAAGGAGAAGGAVPPLETVPDAGVAGAGEAADPAGAGGGGPTTMGEAPDGGAPVPSSAPTPGAPAAGATAAEATAGAAPSGPSIALDAGRLVLVTAGSDPGWERAEASLVESWIRAGVRVPDPASLDGAQAGAASRGDAPAIRALARAQGAATLVVATLRTGAEPSLSGFFTGSAELVLRRYDGASGDLAAMETVQVGGGGVPGKLGPTPESALGDAAAEAGSRAAALVLRGLR
jgi:eukaryotic-like serine/threonine-protein kinase